MKFSWATFALLVVIVIVSIFVANVANLINIDRNRTNTWNTAADGGGGGVVGAVASPSSSASFVAAAAAAKSGANDGNSKRQPTMGTDASHLMWFLQISDLHISIFGDQQRIEQFREFVSRTLDTIRPAVVLASGDLTDAKDSDHLGSRQYRDEWEIYRDILHRADVRNRTVWLDIRGNHDNFNVPGDGSAQNYFRTYSVQGAQHARSYMRQVVAGTGGERYTFIAVDACLEPGPKRPFNFIGVLTAQDARQLQRLADEAHAAGGDYTIWFGHYPTSCIVTEESGAAGLRRLIGSHRESVVYMCGHLHQLGGAVPRMYTLQRDGFLELELGDWKSNRTYRLAAIDHGMFSFVDVQHGQWPVVLVTNPKNALYHLPDKEDPAVQMDSTHIRLLIFSPSVIEECAVRIDYADWIACHHSDKQLFVAAWQPAQYASGLHHIEVRVTDAGGRRNTLRQPFSIDGTHTAFPLLARIVLMCDVSVVFKCLFAVAASLCVAPLLFFRGWHWLAGRDLVCRPTLQRVRIADGHSDGSGCVGGGGGGSSWCTELMRSAFRRYWFLSTINTLTLPLIVYIVFLCVGPWAYGEVVDGHWGWIFAWGIYVNGGYLPGSLTYLYGFFQLVMCQLPLMCIFGQCVDERYRRLVGVPEKMRNGWTRRCAHVPFALIVAVEVVLAVFFWNAYGPLAFVCGPFRTWSVVLHVVLWWIARRVPDESIRLAMQSWAIVERKSSVGDISPLRLPHRL